MELCECEVPDTWVRSDGVEQCQNCARPTHETSCLHVRSTIHDGFTCCVECGREVSFPNLKKKNFEFGS
jgi:hypothetical protein